MIKLNDQEITPTIFPDDTSQVWKLPLTLIKQIENSTRGLDIVWHFDHEGELIHLLQLMTLIRSLNVEVDVCLTLPYLPYARQDKGVSNDATFALHTFLGLIAPVFDSLVVFDPHSEELLEQYFGDGLTCVEPCAEIQVAIDGCNAEVICFPDVSASTRYPSLAGKPFVYMEKVRNQSTGEITGMKMHGEADVTDKCVLIVDDLCDGGRTFREASKILYYQDAEEVNLYVSHGIFSHYLGVMILHEDGINQVYTEEGLVSDVREHTKAAK